MDTDLPDRPLVQIDDLIRPMKDEELADYIANVASRPGGPEMENWTDEAPASDDAGAPSIDAG